MDRSNRFSRRTLFILLAVTCALAAVRAVQAGKPESDRAAEAAVKYQFGIAVRAGEGSLGRAITFFAISPDSKTLAYCDVNHVEAGKPGRGELVLVDLTTGKELQRRRVEAANTGVFSPDGKQLAVGTQENKTAVSVWDVASWEPKVELKRPDDHLFGSPLAFSPDGKLVAGRAQRDKPIPYFSTDDLVLWDVATGACRVLEDDGAKRFRAIGGRHPEAYTVVVEGKDGKGTWPPARLGSIIVGAAPLAASFPDTNGSDRLFVEYGDFVTVWDVARGKALSTDFPLGLFMFRLNWGGAISAPEHRVDHFRFRTAPSGRILELPRYDPPPVTAFAEENGAIVLAATPIEKDWGARKSYNPSFPLAELCRLEDYRGPTGPMLALSPDGRRLVALGIRYGTENVTTTPTRVLRVWDISALHPIAAKKMQKLAGAERERLWTWILEDLVDSEKPQPGQFTYQFQAMFSLVLHGDDAVRWLRDKMGPPFDLKKVPLLIEELESNDFDTRERASRELERLGQPARPSLERALAKEPPPETKRRGEKLLNKLKETADAYELRQMRIIDVLEHINTPSARDLLQLIADGKYDPSFAEEAKLALKRAAEKR